MESMSANDLPESLRDHWKAIQKEFPGVLLYIPVENAATAPKKDRNREIFAEHLKGKSVKYLMDRYGLSRTRVYKILADCRGDIS